MDDAMFHPLRVLLAAFILLTVTPANAGMDKDAKGTGLYGDEWRPDAVHEYWDPEAYHKSETDLVEGRFTGEECIECHEGITPGIVKDWRQSRHSSPTSGEPVTCNACHGDDHQKLR
ncbi:MAG: hypothetical protein HOL37_06865, partial [Rhodospirillaceae bacterium]|nr:hypothetical protein [Rhodospirillaceae bacterium]